MLLIGIVIFGIILAVFIIPRLQKQKKQKIKEGDIVALKSKYLQDYNNISLSDQLSVVKLDNHFAEVTFMSVKTKKIYRENLPEESIKKIS